MARSPGGGEEGVKKGPWTPEEDEKLVEFINKNGLGSWRALPKLAGLNRCGKSCRLRWMNYLRPEIKRGNFTEEEENLIIELHKVLGNKWSRIATHLPGRTDNEIKNFWNTHLRKKLLQRGIDPNTHKQRIDLNPLFNLPQLLLAAQSCFGINLPTNHNYLLDNIFNRLHNLADPTELAKIQLLQNLILLMNTTPNLPQAFEYKNSILGSGTMLETLNNLKNTLQSQEPTIPGLNYSNTLMNSNYNIYNDILANNSSALGTTNVGVGVKTENNQEHLPALVCPSSVVEALCGLDGVSDTKLLGSHPKSANNVSNYSVDSFSSTDASSSHTSSIFADLENLMKDDSSASFLHDILK